MSITNIKIEGIADIDSTQILCVCKCGNHDSANATIEFNFREQCVFYTCSKCKKINEMKFGEATPSPLPRTRM